MNCAKVCSSTSKSFGYVNIFQSNRKRNVCCCPLSHCHSFRQTMIINLHFHLSKCLFQLRTYCKQIILLKCVVCWVLWIINDKNHMFSISLFFFDCRKETKSHKAKIKTTQSKSNGSMNWLSVWHKVCWTFVEEPNRSNQIT